MSFFEMVFFLTPCPTPAGARDLVEVLPALGLSEPLFKRLSTSGALSMINVTGEGDVKRGIQRAKGRCELGYALGVVGFIFAQIIGAAAGSWLLGLGLGIAALIGGIMYQYS